MPPRSPFTFDATAGRYRDSRGRFVERAEIVRALNSRLAIAQSRVADLTVSLRERRIALGAWELAMQDALYEVHSYSAMAARGGIDRMNARAWGQVGAELRRQRRLLRTFADSLAAGMPIDGRVTRRAELYGLSGVVSFDKATTDEMTRRGYDEESNQLGDAEHCDGPNSCIEQTDRGWVPIGALVPIGSRLCLTRCRCSKKFRNSQTGKVAA